MWYDLVFSYIDITSEQATFCLMCSVKLFEHHDLIETSNCLAPLFSLGYHHSNVV
jgi:hypothetical protein